MADPHVRTVGLIGDDQSQIIVGVDYDAVTLTFAGEGRRPVKRRLESADSEEFGRLFIAACWQAAHQRGQFTAAGIP